MDQDQDYLREVSDPVGATIDIIAVHGLNPFNKQNHAETTWSSDDGHLWLRDSLPAQVPHARIFLFSYNANVAFATSTNGVKEAANSLLNQAGNKDIGKDTARPLILIGHSLGGIVIKQAIVSARITNDPEHQAVGKAARGLVFFGTPHQGSDYGAIGDVLSSIVRVVRRETSNDIMKSLKRGSKSIDTLMEDFSHHQERFRVVTFCETLPTASHIKGPRRMIVDKKSAALSLPGNRQRIHSLQRDHVTLCKFAKEERLYMELVQPELIKLAVKCLDEAKEQQMRQGSVKMFSATAHLRAECLDALSPVFNAMNRRLCSKLTALVEKDDCSWLFQAGQFASWDAAASGTSFLAIEGYAGEGKSAVLAKATENSNKLQDRLTLSFFFDDTDGAAEHNNSLVMYQTMLYQALRQVPRPSVSVLEALKGTSRTGCWTVVNTQALLKKLLLERPSHCRRVSVFIDALDEWDRTDRVTQRGLRGLVDFLQELMRTEMSLKVCWTKRPNLIADLAPRNCGVEPVTMTISDFNKPAVERLIATILSDLCSSRLSRAELQRQLSARASHNFMWATLVTPNVVEKADGGTKTEAEIQVDIDTIPEKLEALYGKLLGREVAAAKRTPQADELQFLFLLVMSARETLCLDEVMDAVCISQHPEKWREQRAIFEPPFDFATRVIEMSGGLIRVGKPALIDRRRMVQFSHSTVRPFLLESGFSLLGISGDPLENSHLEMFKLCMQLFRDGAHEALQPGHENAPWHLRQYAASWWMEHASACGSGLQTPQGPKLVDRQSRSISLPGFLVDCEANSHATEQVARLYQQNLSSRSRLGLARTTAFLEEREGRLLVLLASEDCTQLLLIHRLSCACAGRQPSVGDDGQDADTLPTNLEAAQFQAVVHEKVRTVECFKGLQHRVDILHDRDTCLYQAVRIGNLGIVRALLDMGARPGRMSEQINGTPLTMAKVIIDHPETPKLGRHADVYALLVENASEDEKRRHRRPPRPKPEKAPRAVSDPQMQRRGVMTMLQLPERAKSEPYIQARGMIEQRDRQLGSSCHRVAGSGLGSSASQS